MGSPKISPEQKAKYLALRRQGFSQAQASDEAGISRSTAHRLDQGVSSTGKERRSTVPAPVPYEDLLPIGQEALKSFPTFAEVFFCTRVAPWWARAAEEAVAAVMSHEQTFTILNAPSGAGKTTLLSRLLLWLMSGGGSLDPASGRALRFMYGSATMPKSVQVVDQLRRILEDSRPFYDFKQKLRAEHSLVEVFGRFKPLPSEGDDESVWQQSQFTVAQLGEYGLYQKDPTLVAASIGGTVISSRIDVAVWDDPASFSNLLAPDLADRFVVEAESRIEPEGSFFAVGQRLGVGDLYGTLLERSLSKDEGDSAPFYSHIVFPAHNEESCDGAHRQWDLGADGCLLDEYRLPWSKLLREQAKTTWAAMYQQRPEDDTSGLVPEVHIFGGTDETGFEAPGCLDRDRLFGQHPEEAGLIDYVTVDPAVSTTPSGGYWAVEWWAVDPLTRRCWLIEGHRTKMVGSDFVDHDGTGLTGFMPDLQAASVERGHPIRVWVIEKNRADFLSSRAVDLFRRTFSYVTILTPHTQKNKTDRHFGIEALLPGRYRNGEKRLPYRGVEAMNYMRQKIHELSRWPRVKADDTVMSDWLGEANLSEILNQSQRNSNAQAEVATSLPEYLNQQTMEVSTQPLSREEIAAMDWIDRAFYEQEQKEQRERDRYWHPRRPKIFS